MDLTTTRTRARRGVTALAVAAALTTGGVALGGGVAAADTGTLAAGTGTDEPVAIGLNPATVRWLAAVGTCSKIYPPGTDLTSCIANLY